MIAEHGQEGAEISVSKVLGEGFQKEGDSHLFKLKDAVTLKNPLIYLIFSLISNIKYFNFHDNVIPAFG